MFRFVVLCHVTTVQLFAAEDVGMEQHFVHDLYIFFFTHTSLAAAIAPKLYAALAMLLPKIQIQLETTLRL